MEAGDTSNGNSRRTRRTACGRGLRPKRPTGETEGGRGRSGRTDAQRGTENCATTAHAPGWGEQTPKARAAETKNRSPFTRRGERHGKTQARQARRTVASGSIYAGNDVLRHRQRSARERERERKKKRLRYSTEWKHPHNCRPSSRPRGDNWTIHASLFLFRSFPLKSERRTPEQEIEQTHRQIDLDHPRAPPVVSQPFFRPPKRPARPQPRPRSAPSLPAI